jgi:hypothetical protein
MKQFNPNTDLSIHNIGNTTFLEAQNAGYRAQNKKLQTEKNRYKRALKDITLSIMKNRNCDDCPHLLMANEALKDGK